MTSVRDLHDLSDADLAACYAAPAEPWLRLNFVVTVDGAVQGPDGLSKSINNEADGRVFMMLRGLADVLVVGAGTIRDEGYQPNPKPLVVVSRSGQVPVSLRAGDLGQVYVATGDRAPYLTETRQLAAQQRRAQLEPAPADPTAMADIEPGGVQWNWETLLRNRALDAWMHEQDIRRAIGKPGGQSSAGAQITVRTLAAALPFVIGKRAAAPQGHAVLVEIEGPVAISRTYAVDENGRAGTTDAAPQTTIALSSEAYARLAGGREPLETFEVRVTGDAELAARILANLAVTP